MFIQTCLQRTISTNSHVIISIRTFKRFGEYVKGYGHEPKYYQGGMFNLIRYVTKSKLVHVYSFFKGYLPRAPHLKDPPDYLPPFIDPKEWTLEAATFGQNDYIGKFQLRIDYFQTFFV